MRTIFILWAFSLALAGCERYRYPCQDPDNWEKKECKKPYCTTTGTCPEDVMTTDDMKADNNEPIQVNR